MRRVIPILVFVLATMASAKPEFLVAFDDHYKPAPGSPAAEAQCRNCHTSPPEHNAYGKAVMQVMHESGKDEPDAAVFAAVEKMTGDDGMTFGSEMPARTGRPATAETSSPKTESARPLVPAHSFHPTIVHFPIALFLFGAFLEVLGKLKRKSGLRDAAWPCLLGGALVSVPTVALGFTAAIRLGYGLNGKAETHMLLALAASGCMLAVVARRRTAHLDSPGYWVALVVGAGLVALAGHLGGMLVFG
ncbi:MAG: hypothetical protein KF857_01620 [Fimbriimonadaceae bacterium]|nr:hypothetical protein [Fimbriimonadaceae bacterium]